MFKKISLVLLLSVLILNSVYALSLDDLVDNELSNFFENFKKTFEVFFFSTGPPDQSGNYLVGTFDGSFTNSHGEYKLTVYYPATYEGKSTPADKSGSPYPGVVFVHGFAANKNQNTWIGKQLASWGYVTVMISVPNSFIPGPEKWSDGIKSAIDYLLTESTTSGSIIQEMVQENNFGVTGHSVGAGGTLVASSEDSRIKAGIPIAPCYQEGAGDSYLIDAAKEIEIPIQIQSASLDGFCPPEGAKVYYGNLSSTKEIIEIKGGNHVGFMDEGTEYDVAKSLDKKATISRAEQIRISKKYMISWFNYFLKADTNYHKYIFGTEAQNDLNNGVLSYLDFSNVPTTTTTQLQTTTTISNECSGYSNCGDCVSNGCQWCQNPSFGSPGCKDSCDTMTCFGGSCFDIDCPDPTTTTQPQTTTTQSGETTTTQPQTTTTQSGETTTTQPQTTTTNLEQFLVSDFSCNIINRGHRCSINYNNQLNQDVILVFLYTDSQARLVSSPAPVVPQGSGSTASNFYCNSFDSDDYLVSWRAYRESDETLSDPVAWSKSSEVLTISC